MHLGEQGVRRPLDVGERRRPRPGALEQARGRAGLLDDRHHVAGHDVVQQAGAAGRLAWWRAESGRRRAGRQHRPYAEIAARRPHGESAARGCGPLPHAQQPVSGTQLGRAHGQRVDHLDLDRFRGVPHGEPGGAGAMLVRVGQRLLRDPVRRQVGHHRQLPRLAELTELHRKTGRRETGQQVGQPGEAGRRLGVVRLVRAAQHAHHRLNLGEHAVRRLPDVVQGGRHLIGPAVEDVGGRAGLHVDHRDVVRHHVVQLAGDAQPLLGDPAAGLLLAAVLGAVGPLLHLADVRPVRPGRVAHRGRQEDPGEQPEHVGAQPHVPVEQHHGHIDHR
jgi:hypothetical protein